MPWASPTLPRTHPRSGPLPWSSGLLQVTWHTACPQTRGLCLPSYSEGRIPLCAWQESARWSMPPALPHFVSATQGAEVSSSPAWGQGLEGYVGDPGESGSDRATCVMQWPGPLAGASVLDHATCPPKRRHPRGWTQCRPHQPPAHSADAFLFTWQ